MTATLGRIVHFHAADGETYAAIVGRVRDDSVDLTVFSFPGATYQRFVRHRDSAAAGEMFWDWPPRVP